MYVFKDSIKITQFVARESFVLNQKIVYTNNVKEIINLTEDHVVNLLIY